MGASNPNAECGKLLLQEHSSMNETKTKMLQKLKHAPPDTLLAPESVVPSFPVISISCVSQTWTQELQAVAQTFECSGRSGWIRTSGPCLPKTVLYQAELHSDLRRFIAPSPC